MNQRHPADNHPERECGLSTLAVHAGETARKPGDSITDPIFCASTYTFADTQAVLDYIEQEQPREEYGRYGNPERKGRRAKARRARRGRRRRAVLHRHVGYRRRC